MPGSRVARLIWLIQEIRNDPKQDLSSLLKRVKISKSQFYKDKNILLQIGFEFGYKKSSGFTIIEDRLSAAIDLSLSDRILILFALRHLCVTDEGYLAAKALDVGKKLAYGIEEPFRSQVLEEYDNTVIKSSYGCSSDVLEKLKIAIKERIRIKIEYDSRHGRKISWREIDPLRIYFLQRALYLYARCQNETSEYRTFRINRIKNIKETGIRFSKRIEDDEFYTKLDNAFIHFMGKEIEEVVIKFTGKSVAYICEGYFHSSQKIEYLETGDILFKVAVAEPKEVLWWCLQFGEEAEIISPVHLRIKAKNIAIKMISLYKDKI